MIDEKKLIEHIKEMPDTCNLFRWRSPKKIKDGITSIIAHEPKISEWIYCGDGKNMKEEHDSMFAEIKGTDKWDDAMFEKISDDVNATVEYENGKRKAMTLHTIDGKWKTDRFVKFKVIAWQPLPKEYKG